MQGVQLYPNQGDMVCEFIRCEYRGTNDEGVKALWDLGGAGCMSEMLKWYVHHRTSTDKLITELIPGLYGRNVRSYTLLVKKQNLQFVLDEVPATTHNLNLANGKFRDIEGSIRLSGVVFATDFADASLAAELVRPTSRVHTCISEFIRYEEATKMFRTYQPKNGVWKPLGIEVLLWLPSMALSLAPLLA